MPKLKLAVALAALSLALTATSVAGAAEVPLSAHFKGKQTRNDPPCATGVFCGTGTVAGYGAAEYAIIPTSVGPLVGRCQSVTGIVNVALTAGTGTMTLAAAGEVCFPGKSQSAPGQVVSFGNPFKITAGFDVVGGTGAFAGAGGGGDAVLKGAGAATKLALEGLLTI